MCVCVFLCECVCVYMQGLVDGEEHARSHTHARAHTHTRNYTHAQIHTHTYTSQTNTRTHSHWGWWCSGLSKKDTEYAYVTSMIFFVFCG